MEEKNSGKDVQSLLMDFPEEEKVEEETFESKMDSLFNQLDAQFEKVKRYANVDVPLDQVEIDQYKFKYNNKLPENKNNIIISNTNEDLIDLNFNNESKENKENQENKDNNDNIEGEENMEIKEENKRVQIKEIKDDEEMKKKMYDEMAYQRMEEERKIKEMEIENERKKNIEEEKRIKEEAKRIKEEQRKKEEELIRKEKEILKKEKELERKRKEEEERLKEEEKRLKEEQRKREEEEEQNEKWRLLKEEEDKLKKEEEEKEKEEKRESDRIKELRILREKQEKEEKERKLLEDKKKEQLEKLEKEKEFKEQQQLKEQIKQKMNNNNNTNNLEESNNENNEIKIDEINSDDSIQELEEFESNVTKTQMQESKNKTLLKSNQKSINPESNNSKFRSANKNNKNINSKFNNISRNRNLFPQKKSQVKESNNKNIKKPKGEKTPEKDFSQEKKEKNREESEFANNFKNSKVASKISQDIIDKILEIIYDIDDFEDKKSEDNEINIYPSIKEFDAEEKSLKDVIPDFEKKILEKDKMTGEDRMKKYYNEEEAFEDNQENLKINELIGDVMHISDETHMDLLQKKFEKENLKNLSTKEFDNFDNIEEIEIKLFEKEDFYPEYNPIISNLENLKTFIYKFRDPAEQKPEIMVNAYKYFNYWRLCLNDGNSFYRVNMFALIEHCILEKDSNFLFYILSEISSDEFIEYYKEKKIEYEKPFKILSVIRLFIEKNSEEEAHKLLLKAYNLKSGCFDILLITYLKKALINYAEEINKLLEEKKKSEENSDIIEEAKIDIAQIETMYLDPPKVNLFYLVSGLFNINIQLYLLGGKYLEPINSLKEIKLVETSPTFVFGYFYSGYNILYNPDYDSNEIFQNIAENDNPQLSKLTHQLKEQKKCDVCFKETKHVVFLKKKFIVCIPCLLDKYKEKIKKRSEYFFEDNCLGQEYYSRPIHLQGEFYIDDYEYSELIDDDNIINNLYANTKGSKCISCEKMKSDDDKMITLDCKCCFCSGCFKKLISNLTKNTGFLLPCEVDMFGKKFKCNCDKLYTYNDLLKFCNITDEQKEDAKERLSHYKDTCCLICLRNLMKDDDMKKIKIRKEKPDDKDHFICNKCFRKHFKNEANDSEDEENTKDENNEDNRDDDEIKVVKEEHKIKCSICRRWHHYSGSSEGCGCNIF